MSITTTVSWSDCKPCQVKRVLLKQNAIQIPSINALMMMILASKNKQKTMTNFNNIYLQVAVSSFGAFKGSQGRPFDVWSRSSSDKKHGMENFPGQTRNLRMKKSKEICHSCCVQSPFEAVLPLHITPSECRSNGWMFTRVVT